MDTDQTRESMSQEYKVQQLRYVTNFKCNSKNCFEVCCNYSGVININIDFYKQEVPEVVQYFEEDRENERGDWKLKRRAGLGCPMCKDGLCRLQINYGAKYLPELCYAVPRAFILINEAVYYVVGFALCSEIVKSVLLSDNAFEWSEESVPRLPVNDCITYKTYNGYKPSEIINLHNVMTSIVDDENFTSEEAVIRLLMIAQKMDNLHRNDCPIITKDIIGSIHKNEVNELCENIEEGSKRNNVNDKEFINKMIYTLLAAAKDRDEADYDLHKGVVDEYTSHIRMIKTYLENTNSTDRKEKYKYIKENSNMENILRKYIKLMLAEKLFPINICSTHISEMMFLALKYICAKIILTINYEKYDNLKNIDEISKMISINEASLYAGAENMYKFLTETNMANIDVITYLLLE
ncbi:MAG: hypothetical protein WC197_03030 [Candidatus Gastranaerophilaceae bacterium]|jgi:hypothetical protein